MPEKFQKYVDTWRFTMPDYEINYVTLGSMKHSPFVDKALEQGLYTVANHYIRCQEVYDKGGIYLDLDIEVVKKFDDLLKNKFFAGWEDRYVVNNAVFGAEKGCEFLKRCMDEMDKWDWNKKDVELETGPRLFTRNIDATLQLYPPQYFYPYHYTEKYSPNCVKSNTYCIHHWAKSWDNKLVTVVVPCYNYAKYLPECIGSIRAQTYKNIEILVVSDGSPDNTEEVCKELGVTCLIKPNGGLSSARNYGVKHAKGDLIMCLDADDKLTENSIADHVSIAGKGIIAHLGMIEFGDSHGIYYPMGGTLETMKEKNTLYCNAMFYKQDWIDAGGSDESEIMRLGLEDWDCWLGMMKRGCVIKTLHKIGMFYRVHQKSMTRTTTQKNYGPIIEYMRNKHKELYE